VHVYVYCLSVSVSLCVHVHMHRCRLCCDMNCVHVQIVELSTVYANTIITMVELSTRVCENCNNGGRGE
jgi:hypothetical protein